MGIIIVYRCRVAGECFGENPAWIHACDRIAAVLPTSGKGLQGMNGYAEETVMPKKRLCRRKGGMIFFGSAAPTPQRRA